ncbi:uncharacterized protein LOC141833837 isoform X2 [Curcuma longa]|uniref:uncharacterized protein LOC141833837 isoform X2 n=1 Tax=Curcuma longa TaxID=136217 RepID=UPI003D9E373C
MEKLRLDLVEESEATTSGVGDEVYEEIEAPRFVDFTVPDCSRQDDRSWFCSRVGCDQTHEEVDPDALLRSFRLRVMAARTPNARRGKAWDREAPSLIPKCPKSAPAKSLKCRIVGLSTVTSLAKNMAKTKLKDHPILRLRSNPGEATARAHHSARRGTMTTSKIQKHSTNQEGFRSMRHPGEPVGVVMNNSMAKSLFVETVAAASTTITNKEKPESTSTSKCETSVSEVCVTMKNVKVAKHTKNVPSRYLCITKNPKTTKNAGDSAQNLVKAHEIKRKMKLKSEASSKLCNPSNESEVDREMDCNVASKVDKQFLAINADKECLKSGDMRSVGVIKSTTMGNCQKDIKHKASWIHSSCKPDSGAQKVEMMIEVDDDKENAPITNKERVVNSNTRNHASKSIISAIRENVPQKAVIPQINSTTETSDRGKHKRTITNPRPFRLRVDERRILKEANHERRLQAVIPQINSTTETSDRGKHKRTITNPRPFRLRVDERRILKEANHERRLQVEAQAQKKRESSLMHVEMIKVVITKEKSTKKIQSRPLMRAPSRQTSKDKSVTTLRKPLDAKLGRDNSKTENHAVTSKGRKPATVPREPNFNTMHLPRGCSKRAEWKS